MKKLCVKPFKVLTLLLAMVLVFSGACKDDQGKAPDIACSACDHPVAAKGSRLFGMDILNPAAGGLYADNLTALKGLHGNFQTLHLTWASIEAAGTGTATSGTFTDPFNALLTFSGIADADGIKLALTIRPVDATGKTVPSDLAAMRFNDSIMIDRFKQVIDFVVTSVGGTGKAGNLTAIMIGNEIDNYNPVGDTSFWSDYGAFLFAIKTYVSATYPGLKIGFTVTAEAFITAGKITPDGQPALAIFQALAGVVDVVGITYYPLNSDFTIKPPSVVSSDFSAIVAAVPGNKPIHIQEIGYPTSSDNNSSDCAQSEFFCGVMKAWDDHAARIPNLALLRLNDISLTDAQSMAIPYGITSVPFIEYLRTLGIRNLDGYEKTAMATIRTELVKRGF